MFRPLTILCWIALAIHWNQVESLDSREIAVKRFYDIHYINGKSTSAAPTVNLLKLFINMLKDQNQNLSFEELMALRTYLKIVIAAKEKVSEKPDYWYLRQG